MATAFANITDRQWVDSCVNRGKTGFFSARVELTPSLAKELLRRNPCNRSVAKSRVDIYASDIEGGRWVFNGEPIIISSDGRMTDGQHRCEAVVKANKSVETAMAFGVDYESRKTTNQLRPKTAGDFAGMDGIPNAMGQAAIARMVLAYDSSGGIDRRNTTQAEILQFVYDNQDALIESAKLCHSRSGKMKNLVSPSVLGFVHYVTARRDKRMANEYAEQIITGENLAVGDPAMAVRNRFIAMGKATRATKAEILLHGWNAYRRGLKRVMAKTTGTLPEVI